MNERTALALYRGGRAAFPRGASRLLALAATVLIATGCAAPPAGAVGAAVPRVSQAPEGVVTRADVGGLSAFEGKLPPDTLYAIVGPVLGMRSVSGSCGAYLELRIGAEVRLGGTGLMRVHDAPDEGSVHVLVAMDRGPAPCAEPQAASLVREIAAGDRIVAALAAAPPPEPGRRRNRSAWLDLPRVVALGSLHDVPSVAAALPAGRFVDHEEQWLAAPRVPPIGTPALRARLGGTPRFAVREGEVVDRALGVVWQRTPHPKPLDIREAGWYCEALELGGHADWRLPTVTEAQGLLVAGRRPNALPEEASLAPGPEPIFWTRTDDDGSWVGDVEGGSVISTHYDTPSSFGSYTTRCVRTEGQGTTEVLDRFGLDGDTLVDGLAGLAWHLPDATQPITHAAARAHCESGRFAGQSDWRLPSAAELYTLMEGCPPEVMALRERPVDDVWTSLVEPESGVGEAHAICNPGRSLPAGAWGLEDGQDPKSPLAMAFCVREAPRDVGPALATCPAGSQPKRSPTEVRCEAAGVASGPFRTLYPSGAVFEAGTYDAGRRSGELTVYHEHGGVYLRASFEAGLLQGDVVVTHPSGRPLTRERFERGRPSGTWRRLDSRGRETERIEWVAGEPAQGRVFAFSAETGKKVLEGPTSRGWKHGVVVDLDGETGEQIGETAFEGGWAHGPAVIRYDGRESKGRHTRGERDGEWITTKAGKVIGRTRWKAGEMQADQDFDETGKSIRDVSFGNGIAVGREVKKNAKGIVVDRRDIDAEGTGTIKTFDDADGSPRMELSFKKGVYHGHVRHFAAGGVIRTDEPYVDGRPHGTWIQRSDDGKLQSSVEWVAGLRHGPAESYDYDGALESKGRFENGRRAGTWTFANIGKKATFEVRFAGGQAVGGSWEK